MNNRLRQFAAWATAWTYSDLRRAHLKLSLIYVAIMALVIGVFTVIVITEVQKEFDTNPFHEDGTAMLSFKEALTRAQTLAPEKTVEESVYEFDEDRNALILSVVFEDDTEAKVNIFTGESTLEREQERASLYTLLTDDIDEIIIWVALIVFLASSFGAIIVARVTLEPIAEKMRQQDAFIAHTAHELRNPLAAVSASLESLERVHPRDQEEFTKVLTGIRAEHKRLIKLSEDILTLSAAGILKEKPEDMVNVRDRIVHIVGSLTPFADERDVSVSVDATDTKLRVNEQDIDLIIFNLIHNAIKFSRKGRQVAVRWSDDRILSVIDHGVGIGEDEKDYIFDRFYKADAARMFSKESGSGLGLSLVKEIVERIGATISVESAEHVGTTITVRFLQ